MLVVARRGLIGQPASHVVYLIQIKENYRIEWMIDELSNRNDYDRPEFSNCRCS